MFAPDAARVVLDRAELHAALSDPLLGSMSFLNEVMDRFPSAISFAPGAPHARLFEEIDVARALERYTGYLEQERRMTPAQVRKHLYQYGPSRGLINGLLAQALRRDEGIDVPPEAIVVTVGCQEALLLTLRALCAGPRDLVAVVNPSFVGAAGAARVLDIGTVPLGERAGTLDWDGLAAACAAARRDGCRIRALYVAPDFANPSGSQLDMPSRLRLLDMAHREGFLLLEDNAYAFTAAPERVLPSLKALDRRGHVIYLGTCAKICMPGVRIGYVVADQHVGGGATGALLADELAALKSMVTVNTPALCQAIFGGMLLESGGSLAEMARPKGRLYRANLGLLVEGLARHAGALAASGAVRWNVPDGGFFVRMELPCETDAELLSWCASEFGVLWTPMRPFFLDGGGRRELRLSCSYLDPEQIDEGARRLSAFLEAVTLRAPAAREAA